MENEIGDGLDAMIDGVTNTVVLPGLYIAAGRVYYLSPPETRTVPSSIGSAETETEPHPNYESALASTSVDTFLASVRGMPSASASLPAGRHRSHFFERVKNTQRNRYEWVAIAKLPLVNTETTVFIVGNDVTRAFNKERTGESLIVCIAYELREVTEKKLVPRLRRGRATADETHDMAAVYLDADIAATSYTELSDQAADSAVASQKGATSAAKKIKLAPFVALPGRIMPELVAADDVATDADKLYLDLAPARRQQPLPPAPLPARSPAPTPRRNVADIKVIDLADSDDDDEPVRRATPGPTVIDLLDD